MTFSKSLVLAAVVTLSFSAAATAKIKALTQREMEEQACYNDAVTLCKDDVPDEAKITACMSAKVSQLSPGCAKMFKRK